MQDKRRNSDEAQVSVVLPDGEPQLRVFAMPRDVNAAGDIFGGWLMSQADIAGAVAAARRANGRVATVAIKEFVFLQPVKVGDMVSCYGTIAAVGRTSITVHIEIYVQRFELGHFGTEAIRVAEGTLVYVALDAEGRSRPVPQPPPE